ncbi:hypothetical protein EIP91_004887 [Steccherinum ochraceum]|uniref:alpha-1,2-Mannosidase n=1 Tax=Steccherinum ochraceum TaxID=92696 RepID=A0A4R0RE61_9APHY|nr:hypothetical protein EIP91_004887 [Steccherinum ochraceum]
MSHLSLTASSGSKAAFDSDSFPQRGSTAQDSKKFSRAPHRKSLLPGMNEDEEYLYASDPMCQLLRAYEGAREHWNSGSGLHRRNSSQQNVEEWLVKRRFLSRPESPPLVTPSTPPPSPETSSPSSRKRPGLKIITTSIKRTLTFRSGRSSDSSMSTSRSSSPTSASSTTWQSKQPGSASTSVDYFPTPSQTPGSSKSWRRLRNTLKVLSWPKKSRSAQWSPSFSGGEGFSGFMSEFAEMQRLTTEVLASPIPEEDGEDAISDTCSFHTAFPEEEDCERTQATCIPQPKTRSLNGAESLLRSRDPSEDTPLSEPTFPTKPVWCLPANNIPRHYMNPALVSGRIICPIPTARLRATTLDAMPVMNPSMSGVAQGVLPDNARCSRTTESTSSLGLHKAPVDDPIEDVPEDKGGNNEGHNDGEDDSFGGWEGSFDMQVAQGVHQAQEGRPAPHRNRPVSERKPFRPHIPISSTTAEQWAERAEDVKRAFVHAYGAYEKYAFPRDELFPLTNKSRDIFNGWGVTIYDSMDTMLLMGLTDEFTRALDHVSRTNFTITGHLSFFETTIRYMGGLLSAYAFSHEYVLVEKADELAKALTPAFNTSSGLPSYSSYPAMLAEVASCQLEYAYLAQLTGKKEHYDRSAKIWDNLRKVNLTETGILPMALSVQDGTAFDTDKSIGSGVDSGHEYLLKYYLMTGQRDHTSIDLYMRTINYILEKMIYHTPQRGLLYVGEFLGSRLTYRLEHLSCYFPGLLALGVNTISDDIFAQYATANSTRLLAYDLKDLHKWAAIGLAETCWRTYTEQPAGLGPETIKMFAPDTRFDGERYGAKSGLWIDTLDDWNKEGREGLPPGTEEKDLVKDSSKDYEVTRSDYILRPETVESMYLLWKTTGDPRWRERAWSIFLALERRAKADSGYASVSNVTSFEKGQGNEMPSFFLSETLKYLYLTFLDDDPISLDRWVFNTEAHPFPVFEWSSWEKHKFDIP